MTLIIPLAIADEAPSPSLSLTCVFHHSALCLTDSLALSPASELFSTTTIYDSIFAFVDRVVTKSQHLPISQLLRQLFRILHTPQ
ncbi:hypothetical protein, partial [Escherichia coli]|uniref:hypothetical protein n=3 Tax=Escherichia coli TaxID=562 RepID=UPI001A8CBF49